MRHDIREGLILLGVVFCAGALLGGGMVGGPYAIDPLDINGGGTRSEVSSSGPGAPIYTIASSTGQAGGVGPASGGVYAVYDGFWPAATGLRIPISATLDLDWTYQNTPRSTRWRHHSVLEITIDDDPYDNRNYMVYVWAEPANAVFIEPTFGGLMWLVRGGQRGWGPLGDVRLNVEVEGAEHGGEGYATAWLTVCPLGDINGDMEVNIDDKGQLNNCLNGLAVSPGVGLRDLDLTGDGTNVNIDDLAILNNLLNGLWVP